MPLTKRFKDGIQAYKTLVKDLHQAQQVLASANSAYSKAKRALDEKVSELLKELDGCVPADPKGADRVVEVDGKHYLVTNSPRDAHTPTPSYVIEIKVEK